MKGITYRNTKSTIPRFSDTVHIRQPLGYAYETDSHFVHMYGKNEHFHIISIGLTAIEKKSGTLENWVVKTFGAKDIKPLEVEIGCSIDGVWRPSLFFHDEIFQALNCSKVEMRLAEQALRILIEKLDELFIYIEPDVKSFDVYSHKTRELLILACTEVENSWKSYMYRATVKPTNGKTYTTKDYIKLVNKLYLKEYQFRLKSYETLPAIRPFYDWDIKAPSTSISWYDAYNKTKHDRNTYFSSATLWNCICAVVANLVMHCVKFSPFPLFEQSNIFSSIVKQHFEAEIVDVSSTTFYLNKIDIPTDTRSDLFLFDPKREGCAVLFKVLPLTL